MRRLAAVLLALACAGTYGVSGFSRTAAAPASIDDRAFWALVSGMSEAGGTFTPAGDYRSDNLVSNERSFQQPLPRLMPSGGAYIGVGPEQNFSYIAQLHPSIAFIVDIRRDNLLLHLLYKALFELSSDRAAFVSRLFARPLPAGVDAASSVAALMRGVAGSPRSPAIERETAATVVDHLTRVHRFPLSADDERRIVDIYGRFAREGPSIRWSRDRLAWLPTYEELMVGRDPDGVAGSYLTSEARFDIVKRMETANLVVPLVGDFGGTKTLRAIGSEVRARRATVAAFYTSNVEPYLRGDARTRFLDNVRALPLDRRSVFIRTAFHVTSPSAHKPSYETTTVAVPIEGELAAWNAP